METNGSGRILVIEDDGSLGPALAEALGERGFVCSCVGSVAAARQALDDGSWDVALVDLQLPDGSGIEILKHVAEGALLTETIVLTGHAGLQTAIEAMRCGASDYLVKPARLPELEARVTRAVERRRLKQENASLRADLGRHEGAQPFLTEDPRTAEVLAVAERLALTDLPLLILGEAGTGKELLARRIHACSGRSGFPFVPVNVAGVPDGVLEGDLFGWDAGGPAGAPERKPGLAEVARGGTLFLDGVDAASGAMQPKLLRFLETQEFFRVGGTRSVRTGVRVLASTSRDLKREAAAGRFRRELLDRLNGATLRVAPLRERRGDIRLLAQHFVAAATGVKRLSERALTALESAPWHGNVRELQMVVRRAAALAAGDAIEAEDVQLDSDAPSWKVAAVQAGLSLAELEREYTLTVLARHDGHRVRAARALGIDTSTLDRKLGPGAGN
ncbi:MAG: sigma-54-dependent transcriptional regulator [Vicinamibacteria bacterium]